MSKVRYNQIVDEVYENFLMISKKRVSKEMLEKFVKNTPKVEFINKIKTDERFSKYWGLKIEERNLVREERYELSRENGLCPKYSFEIEDGNPIPNKLSENEWYDKFNVPTRVITVTYYNETIEVYE